MLKRAAFAVCLALLMLGCRVQTKKFGSPKRGYPVGDKPIVIGDGKSIDIDDSGAFMANNSGMSFSAVGDLVVRKRNAALRLAVYQEQGISQKDLCPGPGDCKITVTYVKDGLTPSDCKANPEPDDCGTVEINFLNSCHTLVLTTKHQFSKTGDGKMYGLAGNHVVQVTWSQGSSPPSSIMPSDSTKHVSTVTMCFVPNARSDGGTCTF